MTRAKLACMLALLSVLSIPLIGFCSCDTEAGSILILSPDDGVTYNTNSVELQIQVAQTNLQSAAVTYSLDNVQHSLESYQTHGGAYVRGASTTLSKLSEGEHILVVRATGSFFSYTGPITQDMGSVTVHFFVNTTQPTPSPSPSPTLTPNPTQNLTADTSGIEYFVAIVALIVAAGMVALVFRRKHKPASDLKKIPKHKAV